MRARVVPDRETAAALLDASWSAILADETILTTDEIASLANSTQTSIRFCVLTQLLGKLTDPTLDAMCLQRGDGGAGKWDPRGFAQKVVVPWNQQNQSVLGGSGDPYVSNPLRRPRVDHGLDQMSDREQWSRLGALLQDVETRNQPSHTRHKFDQLLAAVRDRLRDLTFTYVVPPRVSIRQAETLITGFLSDRSGGERGLAVTAALFETFKDQLGLYREVRRGVINATDAATDAAADLECVGTGGGVALAVEVKERRIGKGDVTMAIAKARAHAISELLLCTEGVLSAEVAEVEAVCGNAWASGTNVYLATIADLMRGGLPLAGEAGVRSFVVAVGGHLDRFSTQPRHRKAWKSALDRLGL
jgi:hypothetical protein